MTSATEATAAEVETEYNAVTVPEHIAELVAKATTTMEPGERMRVTLLLVEYADVFAAHEADIGRTTLIEHDVDTGDARPVAQAVRRQSPEEHQAMVDIVETLYRCGLRNHPAQQKPMGGEYTYGQEEGRQVADVHRLP